MGEHRKKKGKGETVPEEYTGKHRGKPRTSSDPAKCEHPNSTSKRAANGGKDHFCPDCKSTWWTR